MCKTCGLKCEGNEGDRCPNCHNLTLVKTSPPTIPKRVDILKDEPVEENI
jgi:DNA-directed RNA polymerase subunit RPC12/RpoP